MSIKIKICFVSPAAYPVLSGDNKFKHIGGAEVQQCMIAKGLARRGHSVSMVCLDYGQEEDLSIYGVRIVKAYNIKAGIPGFRFIHPRITSFWQAMKKCNAEIYYQRSAGMLSGIVAMFAKKYNRRFIYAGAHDTDFMPGRELIQYFRDRWLYRWGLKKADAILVQNENQMLLAQKYLKQTLYLCRSLYPIPASKNRENRNQVLWVSTIREWKRPELFLDIAKNFPDTNFVMAGGPSDNHDYFQKVQSEAETIPNVRFLGFVPYKEIGREFDRSDLFVNTSVAEGFPNTFLQSWSRKIPTVSFFSPFPDSCLDAPGIYADNMALVLKSIQELLGSTGRRQSEGERCYQYFLAHHEENSVLSQYENIFDRILKS